MCLRSASTEPYRGYTTKTCSGKEQANAMPLGGASRLNLFEVFTQCPVQNSA